MTVNNLTPKNSGSYYVLVSNGAGTTQSGSATLTVTPVPPVVNNDSYTVTQNVARVISSTSGVLANDSDANGVTASAYVVTNAMHGIVNLSANGGFTYLASSNYFGSDTFAYRAYDSYSTSSVATVTLNVVAPPAITNQPQAVTVVKNNPFTLVSGATGTTNLHYQWWFSGNKISGATSSSYTNTQAQNKDVGNYFVVVTNAYGAATSSVAALTMGSAPTDTTLGASSIDTSSATLNATVNCQGFASAWYFVYGVTSNYNLATVTNILTGGTSDVAVASPLSGLSAGTTYHYCIAASNTAGITFGNDATFTTSFLPPTASTVAATSITTNSASLNGTVNSQGAAAGYLFLYGTSTNYGSSSGVLYLGAGTGDSNVTFTASGLTPGTTYHYLVAAGNSYGTNFGGDMTFTTIAAPPKADTMSASNVTLVSAMLRGRVNPEGSGTSYYFQFGSTTNYGMFTTTNQLPAGTSNVVISAAIAGLSNGTKYHYSLIAVSTGGTTIGVDATFTTLYPAPVATTSTASDITAGKATLHAAVNPQGANTICYFQYGVTPTYGSSSPTNFVGDDAQLQPVSIPVNNLASGTTYYYSAVAVNAGGTTVATNYGTFTTPMPASPNVSSALAANGTDGQNHMTLNFTNVSGATFTVYCSPSMSAPTSAWQSIGTMTEVSAGQYQFTDSTPATNASCFYRIQSN